MARRERSGPDAPAVSVVVPTYERRKLVVRAVESVLAQSYPDFEVVVVDDGSTDGTQRALEGLDARVRVYAQPNRGVSAARNEALRHARGEIVAFLDSDNRWLPDHLEVVCGLLRRHPEAVAASTCPDFRTSARRPLTESRVVDLLPGLTVGTHTGFISCVAARRSALAEAGGFDERLEVWEDSDLFLRLAMLGPFCVLERRTMVRGTGRDGLRQRGIRSGKYFDAMELSARNGLRRLAGVERPDRDALRRSLQATVSLVRGLRAAVEGDGERAALMLRRACRLRPDFSTRPGLVLGTLRHGVAEAGSLFGATAATARAWPDADCDTARFLALCAGTLAARRRRRREAAYWLGRSQLLSRPLLLLRTRRQAARLLREWLETSRPPPTRQVGMRGARAGG